MTYRMMSGLGAFNDQAQDLCASTTAERKVAQQMLKDLGFTGADNKPLVIDGLPGPNSAAAFAKYSVAKGFGFIGTTAGGNICQALRDDWAAMKKAGPSADCPPQHTRFMGMCVPVLSPTLPSSLPGVSPQPQPQVPGDKPAPSGPVACPPGQFGTPPWCMPIPFLHQEKPTPQPIPAPKEKKSDGLSTNAKLGLGLGAAALLGIAAWVAMSGPKKRTPSSPSSLKPVVASGVPKTQMMTPNPRRKKRKAKARAKANFVSAPKAAATAVKPKRSAKKKSAAKPKRAARRRGPGKIIDLKVRGRKIRWGHTIAPKRHRKKGATKLSQYAWEGFKYPVYDARHARNAIARYAQFKTRYPRYVRETIATKLNRAKKKFKISGGPVKPNRRR